MSVYTRRLAAAAGASQTLHFDVPPGYVWVVKEVLAVFTGPVGAIVVVQDETSGIYLAYWKSTTTVEVARQPMTQTLPAAHRLLVQIVDASGGTTVAVTGFQLVEAG